MRASLSTWVWPLAAFGVVYLLAKPTGASPGHTPPPEDSAGRYQLESYTALLEQYIPGITQFSLGAALRESNWNSSSINDSPSERRKACRGFEGAKSRGFFRNNPYLDDPSWCMGSGGWFGFLPSTGLSQGGKNGPFANAHPALVFEPSASVAMFAGFIQRVFRYHVQKLPREHQNWFAIRRAMAGNKYIYDYRREEQQSQDSAVRLVQDLMRANGWSQDEAIDFALTPIEIHDWPGVGDIWGLLADAPKA